MAPRPGIESEIVLVSESLGHISDGRAKYNNILIASYVYLVLVSSIA